MTTAFQRMQAEIDAADNMEQINAILAKYDEASKEEAKEPEPEPDPIRDAKSAKEVVNYITEFQQQATDAIDAAWKDRGEFQIPQGETSIAISKAETPEEVARLAAEAGISHDPVGVTGTPGTPEVDLDQLEADIAAASNPMQIAEAFRKAGVR